MNALNQIAAAFVSRSSLATNGRPKLPRVFGASRETPHFSIEWAGGFCDGESCVHVARQRYRCGRRDTFRLRVYISQANLEVLEHLRDGTGIHGRIYKVRRTAKHNKQVYTLNYEGKHALAFIALLLPHLVRKREEALAAMSFWFDGQMGRRWGPKGIPAEVAAFRERMYRKLRSLK